NMDRGVGFLLRGFGRAVRHLDDLTGVNNLEAQPGSIVFCQLGADLRLVPHQDEGGLHLSGGKYRTSHVGAGAVIAAHCIYNDSHLLFSIWVMSACINWGRRAHPAATPAPGAGSTA